MSDQVTADEPSVAELFSRDPLSLTQPDVSRIVAHMRESRQRFIMGNAKAGTPEVKKSAATKKGEALTKQLGLDLSDLGL